MPKSKFQKSTQKFHAKPQRADSRRVVIGLHSALEALRIRPEKVSEIWVKEGAERSHELLPFLNFAKSKKSKLLIKKDRALDEVGSSHQGICLFLDETPELDLNIFKNSPNDEKLILVALDEVSDPHNVGAVLRTAWLLGAKGLIVPQNRAAHLTPAVTKVASGAAEHVPLIVVSNLANELTTLKDMGFWVYGLSGEASNSLWQTKFGEKVVLVVGNEEKGLRSTTVAVCDELLSIPQIQAGASFNASVAAAMSLYEVCRQHKNP